MLLDNNRDLNQWKENFNSTQLRIFHVFVFIMQSKYEKWLFQFGIEYFWNLLLNIYYELIILSPSIGNEETINN